ncbi:MAG: S8 family peptidase [Candidatus Geothermincolia bacterium]
MPRPAEAAPGGAAGRLIIKLKATPGQAGVASAEDKLKAALPADLKGADVKMLEGQIGRVEVAEGQRDKAIQSLQASGLVEYVEVDQVRSISWTPNDPDYDRQWHLPSIAADAAWDVTQGSNSVILAVIDTGVAYNHGDLSANCVAGYNFAYENSNPYDDNGHGTHVAGIAAASGNNNYGIAGVGWNTLIMPIKVLDSSGSGYDSDVARGIRFAADNGAHVINMSLGGGGFSRTMQDAIDYAYNKGVVIVAAAGNDGTNTISYPAAMDNVISVAALDSSNNLAGFSNYGQGLDISAPGVAIYSSVPGGFKTYSGTSMATPVVAGTASLVKAVHPERGPGDITQMIMNSASDLGSPGYDTQFGYGKVNVFGALEGSAGVPAGDVPPDSPPPPQVNGGALVWYLAEGYTGPGFDTFILIQNPNAELATFQGEFVAQDGRFDSHYYVLAPQTRMTLRLNDILPDAELATCITSTNGIGVVVERSMYFNYKGKTGGHAALGTTAPSHQWYFPEGYTGGSFDEYILVLNPQMEEAEVTLSLLFPDGSKRDHAFYVEGFARHTIHVDDLEPDAELSAIVSSDQPVIAERAMYFDSMGRAGGSASLGATGTSAQWFFAEGYTGGSFDEYILLLNPSNQKIYASLLFQPEGGSNLSKEYVLAPYSRTTVHVDEILPSASVAIQVSASHEIVAEQALYYTYGGAWGDGSTALGSTVASSQWCVPEGYTGANFETWILIQNTDPNQVADVTVYTMQRQDSYQLRDFSVQPSGRLSIRVNDLVVNADVATTVLSRNGVPIVVSSAMYFNYGGITGGSLELGYPR